MDIDDLFRKRIWRTVLRFVSSLLRWLLVIDVVDVELLLQMLWTEVGEGGWARTRRFIDSRSAVENRRRVSIVNTLRRAAVLELEGATYEGRLTEVLEMIAVLHSDNGFKRKARRRLRAWMLRTVEKKRESKEEKSFSTRGNGTEREEMRKI